MADLDSIKSTLLQRDGCYIESLEDNTISRVKELTQKGRYQLVYRWCKNEDDPSQAILLHFLVDIDDYDIRYSMELFKDYTEFLHLVAEKDGSYYMPSREMCKAMPITSEVLFYSNPRNLNTDFQEYVTGEPDSLFFGDELDWPKYRFDEEDHLVGSIGINDESEEYSIPGIDLSDLFTLGEKVLWEVKGMISFFFLNMLPELDKSEPLLKKEKVKLIGEIVRRSLCKGLFKALGVEAFGQIKELVNDFQ